MFDLFQVVQRRNRVAREEDPTVLHIHCSYPVIIQATSHCYYVGLKVMLTKPKGSQVLGS